MKAEKLERKIRISGKILVLSGLHIGGSKNGLNIGGVDLPVIRTADGVPYIPGSSLRGKLRAMVARKYGTKAIAFGDIREKDWERQGLNPEHFDEHHPEIRQLFGLPAQAREKNFAVTRLVVRDAYLDRGSWGDLIAKKRIDPDLLETDYTENKWENVINRMDGSANPRQIERVPAQAVFHFEMFYNSFDRKDEEVEVPLLLQAMRLLEDDYLGGHGSRGSGQIAFADVRLQYKAVQDYEASLQWGSAEVVTEYTW